MCNACVKTVDDGELVQGLCASCRRRLGLTREAMPEVGMPEPCRRCGHTEIVQAQLRHAAAEESAQPIAATYPLRHAGGVLGDALAVATEAPIGLLVAHICRRCGATEVFAMSPHKIPIGPEYGTRLVKLAPKTPYRG
jgi:hypothetical protein